ncbi:MAG: hypothetical protein ABI878_09185, partial [Acidobacteriota bacterium]
MAESKDIDAGENKNTLSGLAKGLGRLPADKRRTALEMSAALAGISLRVSREFVEAVPAAAEVLSADDLRNWAEFGRRLAMGGADSASRYFAAGAGKLTDVPESARPLVFQICTRQLVLSSSIAMETFLLIPEITSRIENPEFSTEILRLAAEIANRSAKHSSDFLKSTDRVAAALKSFADGRAEVAKAVIALGENFANRTGGMTADLWAAIPVALKDQTAANAVRLLKRAEEFIEFGGSVTLHFVSAGSEVTRIAGEIFDEWCSVLKKIAPNGNAVLIAFLRASPKFFSRITSLKKSDLGSIRKVLELVGEIAETDSESALAAFRSSAVALRQVSIEQFEEWVKTGLSDERTGGTKARRSYFALETRQSNDLLQDTRAGLHLESIQTILRIYIEGLTGKEVEIASLADIPQESRIGDGKTIYLPASVDEFKDDEVDFRLYKVLAAHGAGQIEFGTFEQDILGLRAAYIELSELYAATADQLDAFSLSGYIEDVRKGGKAIPGEAEPIKKKLPKGSDYREVLKTFPEPRLARRIFGTMENARIDHLLRANYRGLRKDLDLMKAFLQKHRPYIFDVPAHQVPFELLFQITMCGGATDDARQFYGQVVSEIATVIESCLSTNTSTVADSIIATSRVYNLFQNISPEQTQEADANEDKGDYVYDDKQSGETVTEDQVKREPQPNKPQDISDL